METGRRVGRPVMIRFGCEASYPPRWMVPPPPLERGLDDEPPDGAECELPPPLDVPDEGRDPLDDGELFPDDGRLTLPPDEPPRPEDEPELPPLLRVEVEPEPRPEPDDDVLPLGVRRAPPIDPMTRRTVSPEPRHESPEVPRVVVVPRVPPDDGVVRPIVASLPLPVERGVELTTPPAPVVPGLPPRVGRSRQSPVETLLFPVPDPDRPSVTPLPPPRRGFSSAGGVSGL